MSVSYDVTATLRAEMGGHPPIILWNGKADGADGDGNVIVTETDIAPTIEAGSGAGGNNLPMILDKATDDKDEKDIYRETVF